MPLNILYYAIPVFVILLSIEAWFTYKENKHPYETKDTFASLGLGIGNVLTGFVTKSIIWGLFSFLYQFRIFTLDDSKWWFWLLLFLSDDFSYYWFHRTSHHVNYFWASHVVHHSSLHYNLAAALRQTWTGNATGAFLFWAWMPLVGFNPLWVLFMQQISLIYQFWIHTETIQKMPAWFEFIFNTPSHHRVHHGSDLKYLDKNHAGILIIWDRLFGSFKKEEERPQYGLTRNIESFNPAVVAFKTWQILFTKAFKSGSLKNGLNYFLQPPGWSHDGSTKTTKQMKKEALSNQ
ncbi:MAG: sterol desaturase family protein [Bacteroidetes bacterium]|nr:sterol desaturase family protein [Bacteroidota bacterium]